MQKEIYFGFRPDFWNNKILVFSKLMFKSHFSLNVSSVFKQLLRPYFDFDITTKSSAYGRLFNLRIIRESERVSFIVVER